MNEVLKKLENAVYCLAFADNINSPQILISIRTMLCQVKETLEALEAKQKTWDQKAVSQEDQPEQEYLTPHNDQKSLEKEQSQRTRNPSKQYMIAVPEGLDDMGEAMLEALADGKSITYPNIFKIQVVDLC